MELPSESPNPVPGSAAAVAQEWLDGPSAASSEARKLAKSDLIAQILARPGNWRVENQSEYDAILVTGKQVNHVLHLLLTLVTIGLWVFVWIAVAIVGGETRYRVSVDEFGKARTEKLG